jgi:hypothetical protein
MNMRGIERDAIESASALRTRSEWIAPIAALAAAALAIAIQTLWLPIDADVSWLITVSERMISGDRLYVDIFELNPPASVWLYLPLVWLAQAIGTRPEAVVAGAFIAGGLASTVATLRIARRLDYASNQPGLAAALPFILLVLPMALFAQREHAALLLALPALAAVAVIADGATLNKRAAFGLGLAAGLMVVIKPYFLFAVAFPGLWAAWKRRSLIPFVPALAGGAVAIGAYAAAIFAFAPAYFDWLPVIARTYGAIHDKLWKLLLGPSFYPLLCLGLLYFLRARRLSPLSVAWLLGAAGFLVATFLQAKNYPNHWLPAAALALAAVAAMLDSPVVERARKALVAAALAAIAVSEMYQWMIWPDPAVATAIQRVAPARPSIIALSPQLTTGHPVTRNVGGHWVGSRAGLFTASGAAYAGLDDPLQRAAYDEDIRSFALDVRRGSPDVVLVYRPSKHWLMSEKSIREAMAAYRPAATTKETEIWVRREPAR